MLGGSWSDKASESPDRRRRRKSSNDGRRGRRRCSCESRSESRHFQHDSNWPFVLADDSERLGGNRLSESRASGSCRHPVGIQISAWREAPDSLAMLKKGQRPHPAALAALVLIRHVALASLNSSQAAAAPHPTEDRSSLENLDRWLATALECTVEGNDAPASLKGWLDRARGSDETDVPESLLDQVNSFQTAVSLLSLALSRSPTADQSTRQIMELAERGLDEALTWVVEGAHTALPAADGGLTVCFGQIRVQIVRGMVRRRRGATLYAHENYLEKGRS